MWSSLLTPDLSFACFFLSIEGERGPGGQRGLHSIPIVPGICPDPVSFSPVRE